MNEENENTFKPTARKYREIRICVCSVLLFVSWISFWSALPTLYSLIFIATGWFCIHTLANRNSYYFCSECRASISYSNEELCPKCGAQNESLIEEEKPPGPIERPMTNDERLDLLSRMKGLSKETKEKYSYPFDHVLDMLRKKYLLRHHRVRIDEAGEILFFILYFRSPSYTWADLCGREGEFEVDPETLKPKEFRMTVMS